MIELDFSLGDFDPHPAIGGNLTNNNNTFDQNRKKLAYSVNTSVYFRGCAA